MTTASQERSTTRPSDELSLEQLREMLGKMQLIRRFEERTAQSYQQAKIGGFCHLYIGQEAAAVGSIMALNGDDPIITAYRDHAHALVRGMNPNYAMAEMYGKVDGCAKGKGGSMHFFDKPHHMYGGHAIVGGQCPLAIGLAFATKYNNENKVTICYLGDGALNQGAFHESMNLAGLWNLPIIFVVENNGYSMGTKTSRGTTEAKDLAGKAAGYGMRGETCDGMDVLATYDCFKALADDIREGGVPAFVDCKTYRYQGHSMSDPQKYRSKEEVAKYQKLDCIGQLAAELIERGVLDQEAIDELDGIAKGKALEAVKFAMESPELGVEELFTDVYSQPYGRYGIGQESTLMKEAKEGGEG